MCTGQTQQTQQTQQNQQSNAMSEAQQQEAIANAMQQAQETILAQKNAQEEAAPRRDHFHPRSGGGRPFGSTTRDG